MSKAEIFWKFIRKILKHPDQIEDADPIFGVDEEKLKRILQDSYSLYQ